MKVKRIVANITATDVAAAQRFYREALELDIVMDHGWIVTYGAGEQMPIQISFATEGGSGTPVPDLSIEVDELEVVYKRMQEAGFHITYGPVNEPWGVRRFFVQDPFGKLVNILSHI